MENKQCNPYSFWNLLKIWYFGQDFVYQQEKMNTQHSELIQVSLNYIYFKKNILKIVSIDGFKEGAQGALVPSYGPNIFSISCSFSEKFVTSYVGAPSYGESWTRPWIKHANIIYLSGRNLTAVFIEIKCIINICSNQMMLEKIERQDAVIEELNSRLNGGMTYQESKSFVQAVI